MQEPKSVDESWRPKSTIFLSFLVDPHLSNFVFEHNYDTFLKNLYHNQVIRIIVILALITFSFSLRIIEWEFFVLG